MAEARRLENWDHTSFLLSKIHNCHIVRAYDALSPRDCNPLLRGTRRQAGAQQVDAAFNAAMCDALAASESAGR